MEFKTIVNAALKFLEKRISGAASMVTNSVDQLGGTLEKQAAQQSRSMARLEAQFAAATKRMEKPTFDVAVDLEPLLAELRDIQAEMSKLQAPDLSTAEGYLKLILTAIERNAPEKIGHKIDAMDAVFKGLKPKDTVKFDDKQMQGLMAALTNKGGMNVGSGELLARSVTVTNVAMATANTEYSYTFPANTVGFELRLRADDVPLLVSYEAGKLPTSGDGSAYFTVPAYFIEKTAGIDWSGKTIYVQSGSASQVLEVIVYTA